MRSYQTKVLTSGPLFAEAAVRYELVGGGHYEVRVRLEAEAPMVFLNEEADTGLIASPILSVEYLLSSDKPNGWQPDIVYTRSGRGLPEKDADLEAALKAAGIELPESQAGTQSVAALDTTDDERELFTLNLAGRWTTSPVFAAFLRREDLGGTDRPFVGIIPLHAGRWRNGQGGDGFELQVVELPGRQVAFCAPLTSPARRDSYLHTGEYDNKLPAGMVRRVWGIMTGPAPASMQALWDARLNHGYVTLDDYKDWVLQWPADPAVTYPRLFFTAGEVARAQKKADENPFKDELLELPYFSEDPALGNSLAEKATGGGRFKGRGYAWQLMFRGGYMALPWISGFHQANYARWTRDADAALSFGDLDPALRKRLRAVIAACAHAASEPDVTRRGCGVHQGNPNMPIRRFLVLPHIAGLIPDHPRAKEWLGVSAQYVDWKFQTMVGPKGDWGEPGLYYNASLPYFLQATIILQNAGYLSDESARQCGAVTHAICNFLTPPDPRFEDARVVPGMGHGAKMGYVYAFLGGERTPRFENEDVAFIGRAGAVRVGPDGVRFVLATADGDGTVSYKGMTHTGPAPFEVVVPNGKLKSGTVTLKGPKYQIDSASARLKQEGEDIVFEGSSGGVEVLDSGATRLVLGPGRGKVGYKGFTAWGEGPFDLTVDTKEVRGVTEGRERMIYMTRPANLEGTAALWIDGTGSAPGYSGHLAVPVNWSDTLKRLLPGI